MSKLQNFLEELTDQELINFHHYRYQEFLKISKARIDWEIEKRGILDFRLDHFFEFPSLDSSDEGAQEICPRCLSSKFYTSHEIETINYSYSSVDFEVDYRICLVCLYSADKDDKHKANRSVGVFGFLRTLMNRKR